MRPLTQREKRAIAEWERKHEALLAEWGVSKQDLLRWRRHALAARRLSRDEKVRLKRYGREAASEDVGDYELCLDLCGRYACESVKGKGGAIADVRDRYEAIALGFRCARGAQSSEAPLALGSALNALAEEFQRDHRGLLRFLDAVFKRWRKDAEPRSVLHQRVLMHQLRGTPKEIALALQELGAVQWSTTSEHLCSARSSVRQQLSRDKRAALKRRGL